MKTRTLIFFSTLIVLHLTGTAQKVYTKNGGISFFSKSPLENIQADNNQVMSVLNTQTGDLQFSVLIKSFHFKKSKMEEHFNEDYMESEKYPKSLFKGKVTNLSKINFAVDGSYAAEISGDLTIHGVTKKVATTGTIVIKSGIATATSAFKVKLADYNVSIPRIVKDNIAEIIDINVSCVYDKKL
jgi:polyisoprenoid-binding protein YceI